MTLQACLRIAEVRAPEGARASSSKAGGRGPCFRGQISFLTTTRAKATATTQLASSGRDQLRNPRSALAERDVSRRPLTASPLSSPVLWLHRGRSSAEALGFRRSARAAKAGRLRAPSATRTSTSCSDRPGSRFSPRHMSLRAHPCAEAHRNVRWTRCQGARQLRWGGECGEATVFGNAPWDDEMGSWVGGQATL